jgi:peptidoglycan/LPS O-acetylase OafA/YrhL
MGLIRILLALSVVIVHTGSIYDLVGGELAVQAFYIISGFYMSLILNEKYINTNNSYSLFISNRFLRLFPLYWIILILTILFSLFVGVYSKGENFADLSSFVHYSDQLSPLSLIFLIFTNIFLIFQDIVMFLGLDLKSGNLFFTSDFMSTNPMVFKFMLINQAWTVGLEIMFYLIAPLLVRKKTKFIMSLIIISVLLRLFIYSNGYNYSPWTYRFFPTELLFFMLGALSYKIYCKLKDRQLNNYFLRSILFFVVAFILVYDFIIFEYKYITFLIIFFLSIPFIFLLTKKWKKDAYIGELSYPIYISHIFVFSCLSGINITHFMGKSITVVIGTIAFSILINEIVARRIDVIRQKRIISKV